MPPKKIVGGAKGVRPIGAKATKVGAQVEAEQLHPELQSNWMELKLMVYDDEKIDDDVKEIRKLMQQQFFIEVHVLLLCAAVLCR